MDRYSAPRISVEASLTHGYQGTTFRFAMLQGSQWIQIHNLQKWLAKARFLTFDRSEARSTLLADLQGIIEPAPFNVRLRFPGRAIYVCFDIGSWGDKLAHVMALLATSTRADELAYDAPTGSAGRGSDLYAVRRMRRGDDRSLNYTKSIEGISHMVRGLEDVVTRTIFEMTTPARWALLAAGPYTADDFQSDPSDDGSEGSPHKKKKKEGGQTGKAGKNDSIGGLVFG